MTKDSREVWIVYRLPDAEGTDLGMDYLHGDPRRSLDGCGWGPKGNAERFETNEAALEAADLAARDTIGTFPPGSGAYFIGATPIMERVQ